MNNKFVVIDLETTGNTPHKGDKITQIAAVVIENNIITEQYTSFINPETTIPVFIKELTGINEEMVQEAPTFPEIADKIYSLIDDAYFVAHNVLFDLGFLQEAFRKAGYEPFVGPIIDTVEMARIMYPTADGYQLNELAQQMGLHHDRPHQADSDAYVTAELFLLMIKKLAILPKKTLHTLAKLSLGLKSDLDLLIDQIVIEKQATVEEIPAHLELFNGIALKKDEPEQDLQRNNEIRFPQTDAEKAAILKKGLPAFEERTGQYRMTDEVYQAFIDSQHAIIEAGTGVGKTLSYLIAAAFFAKQTQECVVISTHTTLLQEQLMTKEIPLLEKMLPFTIRKVLLKGRSHYISLDKYVQSLKVDEDNYDANLTKMQILIWLTETDTGDVDELNLSSGGTLYWNKIKSDETVFLKNSCWRARDFYLKTKEKAQSADIVVTNHALLVTDLAAKQTIIPSYKYVIVDEAHHVGKTAAKQFGFHLDYISIRILLGKLGTLEQKHLFFQLEQVIDQLNLCKETIINRTMLNEWLHELSYVSEQFFETARAFIYQQLTPKHKTMNRLAFRFDEGNTSPLVIAAERYYFTLKDVITAFRIRLSYIESTASETKLSTWRKLSLEEISTILDEMASIQQAIKQLFIVREKGYVTWVEMDKRSKHQSIMMIGEPIVVAPFLQEHFFSLKKSVVLTSATLTVNDSFRYMMGYLGLASYHPKVSQITSAFDYGDQVQLMIPEDIPEINRVPLEEYISSITEYIISIAEATNGRLLILFTSHEMLRGVYQLIKESGFLEDYMLIAQGITSGSNTRLTRSFQRFEKAILLGTSSFWEGVDIPGEDLSCLIIVRLPFSPPDEPVFAAKSEWLQARGENPFLQLALPEAILRFKQGFGRLVRSGEDRGIIIVFDRRIVTKSYGKAFLQSIPQVPIQRKGVNEIVSFIHDWL